MSGSQKRTNQKLVSDDYFKVLDGVTEIRWRVTGPSCNELAPFVVIDGKERGFGTDASVGNNEHRSAPCSDCVLEFADGTLVRICAEVLRYGWED